MTGIIFFFLLYALHNGVSKVRIISVFDEQNMKKRNDFNT